MVNVILIDIVIPGLIVIAGSCK